MAAQEPPREGRSLFDGHTWVGYRTHVKLVRERSSSHPPYRVRGPDDVYSAFASLSECDRERFYTIHLDGMHQVCGVELVSQGTVDSSVVAPREVYKSAILTNASGLILVHNHPSGCPEPSSEDRSITRILKEGGQLLGMPVLDHVIIGDNAYFSFAEAGLLSRKTKLKTDHRSLLRGKLKALSKKPFAKWLVKPYLR